MRLNIRILGLVFSGVILAILLVPAGLVFAQPPGVKVDLTMYLMPGNYNNNLIPGQSNVSYLEIRNNGSQDITNIRFSANPPPDWIINISPPNLASLGSGSTNTVNVEIIPPKNTSRGSYNLTLVAQANETRAVTTAYLTVNGGVSYWLWVGIAVAVVVIIGFVLVYLRFGRK